MVVIVYNYTFVKSEYGKNDYGLKEGGDRIGTSTSFGWSFDGQIFTRQDKHPYNGRYDEPKIVKVYKKNTP